MLVVGLGVEFVMVPCLLESGIVTDIRLKNANVLFFSVATDDSVTPVPYFLSSVILLSWQILLALLCGAGLLDPKENDFSGFLCS